MNKTFLFSIILVFVFSFNVLAHQPRIDFGQGTISNPIQVDKPEISKAYYSSLNGNPEYYIINSDKDFNLYLNILSPDIPNSKTDFSVEVISNNFNFTLNGKEWKNFYEPFGGDNYLQGPELDKQVTSGTYLIKVSNTNNQGKYSLAIGKIESFPPLEIIKTTFALPKIKKDFFNKSVLTAYFNLSGLFILVTIVIIICIIYAIRYLIKKRKINKN